MVILLESKEGTAYIYFSPILDVSQMNVNLNMKLYFKTTLIVINVAVYTFLTSPDYSVSYYSL